MLTKEKVAEILRKKHSYLASEYGVKRIVKYIKNLILYTYYQYITQLIFQHFLCKLLNLECFLSFCISSLFYKGSHRMRITKFHI